jgi:hypothetical protein
MAVATISWAYAHGTSAYSLRPILTLMTFGSLGYWGVLCWPIPILLAATSVWRLRLLGVAALLVQAVYLCIRPLVVWYFALEPADQKIILLAMDSLLFAFPLMSLFAYLVAFMVLMLRPTRRPAE